MTDEALRRDLHAYLAATTRDLGCPAIRVGGVADHVYVANQELHHRHLSFQDEYRACLRRHGVEFDERYVWD